MRWKSFKNFARNVFLLDLYRPVTLCDYRQWTKMIVDGGLSQSWARVNRTTRQSSVTKCETFQMNLGTTQNVSARYWKFWRIFGTPTRTSLAEWPRQKFFDLLNECACDSIKTTPTTRNLNWLKQKALHFSKDLGWSFVKRSNVDEQ